MSRDKSLFWPPRPLSPHSKITHTPGRCPLFLSPNLITKSCYFNSSNHTIFSIPTVLSYSYPHHLKPELFSHLLTGFLTLPSAFPEHSLHCTSLIKSFFLFIWCSDDGYEPPMTGTHCTSPATCCSFPILPWPSHTELPVVPVALCLSYHLPLHLQHFLSGKPLLT